MTSTPARDFARYWRNIRGRTSRLLDVTPDARLDWSPGAGAMTIGDEFRHLALTERWLFVEVARGGVSRFEGHAATLARGRDDIARLLRQCHDESLRILEAFEDADWHRAVVTPAGAHLPAWKWLRAMVEHEAHHRGQIYLMLRLAGVTTPNLFGLSAEEVAARSDRTQGPNPT
jgi:uncharacterized damage-inducible protein DinB